MRLLSKIAAGVAVCALIGFMPAKAEALSLTPADADCTASGNPSEEDFLVDTCGATEPLTFQYKSNVGGSDEGPFAGSYSTAYFNTPQDPSDATISYDGAPDPVINCITADCWLVVKDGVGHVPSIYGFDITGWNGTDPIILTGFWPNEGAISHVSIYSGPGGSGGGGGGTGGGGGGLPEPATLSLFGLGMLGTAWRARRRRVS